MKTLALLFQDRNTSFIDFDDLHEIIGGTMAISPLGDHGRLHDGRETIMVATDPDTLTYWDETAFCIQEDSPVAFVRGRVGSVRYESIRPEDIPLLLQIRYI